MITDAALLLESAQVLVRAAATYVSANTIDLSVNRDIGAGQEKKVLWNIEATYVGGTDITFQQILSAAAALSSPKVVAQSPAIPVADLLIGGMYVQKVPELLATVAGVTAPVAGVGGIGSIGLRYYGVQSVSTGTFTAGQHSTRIVLDVIDQKMYPSGWSIL